MCPDKITLSAWFDQSLGSTAQSIIQQHLNTCSSCSAQIKEWTRSRKLLLTLDDEKIEKPSIEDILTSRRKTPVLPFWKKEIPWSYAAGLALILSLGTLLAGISLNNSNGKNTAIPVVDIHQWDDSSHFTLLSGEEAELLFEDNFDNGQTIYIDVDTALSYRGESELLHNASWNGGSP